MLAFERVSPTSAVRALVGASGQDRRKRAAARELIGAMGLAGYQDKQVRALSTGTRRLVEIACLLALQPTVLLLDEPSSGIAQRETEALGVLLRRLRDDLDLTMVVIEHDIPLIMGLSDRIVAMDAGRVIAAGAPAAVRTDPAVVDAYRHATIQELSTGTRRITELACLVALQPRLVLLDRPSSGGVHLPYV